MNEINYNMRLFIITLFLNLILNHDVNANIQCPNDLNLSKKMENALISLEKTFEKSIDYIGLTSFEIQYQLNCGESFSKELEQRLKKLQSKVEDKKIECSTKINITPAIEKMRDQGSVGWCYAYTAADLLSYKLNKRVSAVYLAVISNEFEPFLWMNKKLNSSYLSQTGGFTKNILNHIFKNPDVGICLEKDAPSDDYDDLALEYLITLVEKFYNQFIELRASSFPLARDNDPLDYSRRINQLSISQFYQSYIFEDFRNRMKAYFYNGPSAINKAFPNVDADEFIKTMIRSRDVNSFYPNLVKKTCEGRKGVLKKNKLRVNNLTGSKVTNKKLLEIINNRLDNDNILELSYYGSILFEPYSELFGPHSSIVVGKRFDRVTSQCEYLIQNSWGEDCQKIDDTHECKNGRVWIKEEFLEKSLLDINWID